MPANKVTNGVTNNAAASRYELQDDGHVAVAEYRLSGNLINFHHTRVPSALEGRGIGGRLVNAALDDAEAKGLEIKADCSFVAKTLERRAAAKSKS